MNRTDLKMFLRRISGGTQETRDQGEWVSAHCPLARWLHDHGTDRSMSFGVKVNEVHPSIFNCYSCKRKGTLTTLLRYLEEFTGDSYRELRHEIEEIEVLGGSIPEWDMRHFTDSKHARLGEPVSDDYLDLYDDAAGHWYLKERGVADGVARDLDLRVDPDDDGVERILFPVFSHKGPFYGYTGRATDPEAEPRIRDYFGLPKRFMLLGSDLLSPDDPYIVLVEGLFDFARLYSFGAPVVAVMHSGVTPQQADVLKELNKPVVVMLDNDKAGREGVETVKKELGRHLTLLKVRYPSNVKDPGELTERQYQAMVKDYRLLN